MNRVGCAILLVVLGAVGWATRDKWVPIVSAPFQSDAPDESVAGWQPITEAGRTRALAKIEGMRGARSPGVVSVSAADFTAYILGADAIRLATTDSAPLAMVAEDKLFVRTRIKIAELGGKSSLGVLSAVLNDTESLALAGRIEPVRPGMAQFRLTEVALRDLVIPKQGVMKLVERWGPQTRPVGLNDAALPITLPSYIAEVRLSGDRVSLYKVAAP